MAALTWYLALVAHYQLLPDPPPPELPPPQLLPDELLDELLLHELELPLYDDEPEDECDELVLWLTLAIRYVVSR